MYAIPDETFHDRYQHEIPAKGKYATPRTTLTIVFVKHRLQVIDVHRDGLGEQELGCLLNTVFSIDHPLDLVRE